MNSTSVKNYSYALLSLLVINSNTHGAYLTDDKQERHTKEGNKAFERLRTIDFAVIVENPDYRIIKNDLKNQNVFLLSDISPEKARSKEDLLRKKGLRLKFKTFAKAYDLLKDLRYDKKSIPPFYASSSKENKTDKRGFLTYHAAIQEGWNNFSLSRLDCFMSWYMASDTFQQEIKKINKLKSDNTATHVVETIMRAYYPDYQKVVNATQKRTKNTRRKSSTFADFPWDHIPNNPTQEPSLQTALPKHPNHNQVENPPALTTNKSNIAFVTLSVAAVALLHSCKKQTKDTAKIRKRESKTIKEKNQTLSSHN